MMPSITLFTPTYNRAHTLPRLYQSICRQTLRNFEWLIVDDGSTDGTQALVEQWQSADNDFPIRYIWQPNQHKKVAFNRGVREARGKWFVPIDSDDELLPDALEQFMRMWQSIPEAEVDRYCAVVGLCVDAHGAVVGDRFPSEPLDATAIEQWFDHRIRGEKLGCLRTDVLRSYLFPEDIPNYVPESVVWFPMAQRYAQRCFNMPGSHLSPRCRIRHSASKCPSSQIPECRGCRTFLCRSIELCHLGTLPEVTAAGGFLGRPVWTLGVVSAKGQAET